MLGHHHVVIGWAGLVGVETLAAASGQPLSDFTGIHLLGVQVPEMPLLLGAVAFGSLLPDIDHPNAVLSNYRIGGIPFLKAASYATSVVMGHRGPTHSLLLWGILTALALSIAAPAGFLYFALAGSLGYLLHVGADSLTRSGVPWLWPLYPAPLGFPLDKHHRFTTGSFLEYVVTGLIVAAAVLLVLKLGWPAV